MIEKNEPTGNQNVPIQGLTSKLRTTAFVGTTIAAAGIIGVFLALGTPSVRFPDADTPNHCFRVASWGFNSENTDFGSDRAGSMTRDNCDVNRQERIANAIMLAIPTSIAGSVGVTALVLRRHLRSGSDGAPRPRR